VAEVIAVRKVRQKQKKLNYTKGWTEINSQEVNNTHCNSSNIATGTQNAMAIDSILTSAKISRDLTKCNILPSFTQTVYHKMTKHTF